jgi:riboflavin kinase / FMN adenylyltransferase
MESTYNGVVQYGSQRAALLGYPTINIPLHDKKVSGVYVAHVTLKEVEHQAAAFADPSRGVLEAHLLDTDGHFYGEHAEIQLLQKIRDSQRYESDEDLKAAIAADVCAVREYFRVEQK